jgi:hypothetical protein
LTALLSASGSIWPLFIILGIFTAVAVLAPLLAPFDPDVQNLLARPSRRNRSRRQIVPAERISLAVTC